MKKNFSQTKINAANKHRGWCWAFICISITSNSDSVRELVGRSICTKKELDEDEVGRVGATHDDGKPRNDEDEDEVRGREIVFYFSTLLISTFAIKKYNARVTPMRISQDSFSNMISPALLVAIYHTQYRHLCWCIAI